MKEPHPRVELAVVASQRRRTVSQLLYGGLGREVS